MKKVILIFTLISIFIMTFLYVRSFEGILSDSLLTKEEILELSFSEYVEKTEDIVRRAKTDPQLINSINNKIIQYNTPYELRPNIEHQRDGLWDKAIIFVHGLWESPFSAYDLAPYFQSRGFLVRTILLPGHGLRVENSLNMDHRLWEETLESIYEVTKKEARDIYLGGFSTGGLLSLKKATEDDSVAGVFLFSVGTKPVVSFTVVAPIVKYIYPWVKYYPQKSYREYDSQSISGAGEYFRLYKKFRRILKTKRPSELDVPIYSAMSMDDRTIDQEEILKILSRYTGYKKIAIYGDYEKEIETREEFTYIRSYDPKRRIMGLSHPSIVSREDNEYVGKGSGHLNIKHYYPWLRSWNRNKVQKILNKIEKGDFIEGALTQDNLSNYVTVRIGYNPYFDKMLMTLDEFIENLVPRKKK